MDSRAHIPTLNLEGGDLPMTFDIHQKIFDEDGMPLKQVAQEYQDELLDLFEQSPEGEAISEEAPPKTCTHSYTPPLDKLLTYTNIKGDNPLPGISYVETFGIGKDDIPELIRMATDEYLSGDDSNEFEFAAPLHAVRALAELHAEDAIEPLLTLYDKASREDNEWMLETLIDVYTTIGPVALPALEHFLADPSHDDSAKNYVTEIIDKIAKKYPEARTECIAVAMRRLADFEVNDPELNSFSSEI